MKTRWMVCLVTCAVAGCGTRESASLGRSRAAVVSVTGGSRDGWFTGTVSVDDTTGLVRFTSSVQRSSKVTSTRNYADGVYSCTDVVTIVGATYQLSGSLTVIDPLGTPVATLALPTPSAVPSNVLPWPSAATYQCPTKLPGVYAFNYVATMSYTQRTATTCTSDLLPSTSSIRDVVVTDTLGTGISKKWTTQPFGCFVVVPTPTPAPGPAPAPGPDAAPLPAPAPVPLPAPIPEEEE